MKELNLLSERYLIFQRKLQSKKIYELELLVLGENKTFIEVTILSQYISQCLFKKIHIAIKSRSRQSLNGGILIIALK